VHTTAALTTENFAFAAHNADPEGVVRLKAIQVGLHLSTHVEVYGVHGLRSVDGEDGDIAFGGVLDEILRRLQMCDAKRERESAAKSKSRAEGLHQP
jgi:hypothetical protein